MHTQTQGKKLPRTRRNSGCEMRRTFEGSRAIAVAGRLVRASRAISPISAGGLTIRVAEAPWSDASSAIEPERTTNPPFEAKVFEKLPMTRSTLPPARSK